MHASLIDVGCPLYGGPTLFRVHHPGWAVKALFARMATLAQNSRSQPQFSSLRLFHLSGFPYFLSCCASFPLCQRCVSQQSQVPSGQELFLVLDGSGAALAWSCFVAFSASPLPFSSIPAAQTLTSLVSSSSGQCRRKMAAALFGGQGRTNGT